MSSFSSYPLKKTNFQEHENNESALRQRFEESLDEIRNGVYEDRLTLIRDRYNHHKPTIFISHAIQDEMIQWLEQKLCPDLDRLGFESLYAKKNILAGNPITEFETSIDTSTYVILLGTPQYLQRYNDHNNPDSTGVGREVEGIIKRLENSRFKKNIFILYRGGNLKECVPLPLRNILALNAGDHDGAYYIAVFDLAQALFLYPNNDADPICKIKDNFLSFKQALEDVKTKQLMVPKSSSSTSIIRTLVSGEAEEIFLSAKQHSEKGNISEAIKLYYKAATLNYAPAQCKLSAIYQARQDIFASAKQVFSAYRMQAQRGEVMAQLIIGWVYRDGFEIPRDYKKALDIFRKAAEQGYANAQYNLGIMYEEGDIVARDEVEALKWYHRAAEQGYADAQYNLGMMYIDSKGVRKNYTKAVEWLQKAAEQGDADAQYTFGIMYEDGEGVPQDVTEAFKWYSKAAEQGDIDAQYKLGVMYESDQGVCKNDTKAAIWFRKAAEQGHVDAQYSLGLKYAGGWGVRKSIAKAVMWLQKAAEQGHDDAQYKLGISYCHGLGVHKDETKAVKWLQKAAEQGHDDAQCQLGVMYAKGYGVTKNLKQAKKLWKLAVKQGNEEARRNLKWLLNVQKQLLESYRASQPN